MTAPEPALRGRSACPDPRRAQRSQGHGRGPARRPLTPARPAQLQAAPGVWDTGRASRWWPWRGLGARGSDGRRRPGPSEGDGPGSADLWRPAGETETDSGRSLDGARSGLRTSGCCAALAPLSRRATWFLKQSPHGLKPPLVGCSHPPSQQGPLPLLPCTHTWPLLSPLAGVPSP